VPAARDFRRRAKRVWSRAKEELTMTKIATLVISGALFTGTMAAQAADKAPAPAAAPVAAKAADKAPAAAPAAAKPGAAPAAAAPAAAAPAAAAAPMTPPTPAPELDALFKPFEGSWKCDTTFAAGSMGPGSPEQKVKSEVKIKKGLNGFFYLGAYNVKKTKTMPGMEGTFTLGYDTGVKAPVSINVDSMGGYSVSTGSGSAADKIVFTGESHMMGMKMKVRETMSKKSDKEIEHVFETDMGKGYTLMGTDACKK
jgi:Protein of unknown function (DUF1579)